MTDNTISSVLEVNGNSDAISDVTSNLSNMNVSTNQQVTNLLDYQFPDATKLLIERYNKYNQLIDILEEFSEGYRLIAVNSTKEFDVLNNKVTGQLPNFESSYSQTVDGQVSGSARIDTEELKSITSNESEAPTDLNIFLAVIRQKLGIGYSDSLEFQNKLKTDIIPPLKKLSTEIEKNQKDLTQFSHSNIKELTDFQNDSLKLSKNLDGSVQEFESGRNSSYKKDPYLIKRDLLRSAVLQIKAENNRIDYLLNVEKSLQNNEEKILNELKNVFHLLNNLVNTYFSNRVESLNNLFEVFNKIPSDLEWANFLSKNKDYLLSAAPNNNYKRNIKFVTFRNNDSDSTIPILEGLLLRKESKRLGLSSKYVSYYFAISKSGYFYGFPSKNIDSNQPNLVLSIPNCEVSNLSKNGEFLFTLRGKDLSIVVPKPKKKYVFKASSSHDFQTWWNVISKHGSVQQGTGILSSDED